MTKLDWLFIFLLPAAAIVVMVWSCVAITIIPPAQETTPTPTTEIGLVRKDLPPDWQRQLVDEK